MAIDFEKIWQNNIAQFVLSDFSFHGQVHWRQVETNGLRLARINGADQKLVRLFAVYHDAKRENEGHDPKHGHRAAELALEDHGVLFSLEQDDLDKLVYALQFHNGGHVSDDLAIGTCWDADRMDLPRVGAKIDPKYMSTELGKDYAVRGEKAFSDPSSLQDKRKRS